MSSDNGIQKRLELLEEKMAWFQSDQFNLDEASAKFNEVDTLAQEIEEELMTMKNSVEVLKQKFDQ